MEKQQSCKSCSKEAVDRVPIIRVIERLDSLFDQDNLAEAQRLLEYWENEAERLGDKRGLLEILNEEIGLYRRLGSKEKGLAAVESALKIIEEENFGETVSVGTILINAATTMKAFGLARNAVPIYERAKKNYEANSVEGYKKAALFNNMATCYAELEESESAEECYLDAIKILSQDNKNDGEIAVSFVNLAHLYHDLDPTDERAFDAMEKAWEYLNSESIEHDGNYAFICSKCAPAFGYFGYFLREKELEKNYERN